VSVSQLAKPFIPSKIRSNIIEPRTFQQEYLAFRKRHQHSTRCRLLMPGLSSDNKNRWTDNDFNRPSGTGPLCIDTQALRTWLLSACPSGTKAIEVPQIILALMRVYPGLAQKTCLALKGRDLETCTPSCWESILAVS
jgi:hypothetical protein